MIRWRKSKLTEKDIIDAINSLVNEFGISFGQAQKPINVILQYHFYLANGGDAIKKVLHCQIDSIILKGIR